MLSNQITVFLKQLNSIIADEHLDRLIQIKRILSDLESQNLVISRFGNHYASCAWSKDDAKCGPESCRCLFISDYKIEALKLMARYCCLAGDMKLKMDYASNIDAFTLSVKTLARQIQFFLSDFKDIVFSEHQERMQYFMTALMEMEPQELINSKHGNHFSSCVWAKDNATEGPDSCRCCFIPHYKAEALKIMTRYYNLKDRISNNKNNNEIFYFFEFYLLVLVIFLNNLSISLSL